MYAVPLIVIDVELYALNGIFAASVKCKPDVNDAYVPLFGTKICNALSHVLVPNGTVTGVPELQPEGATDDKLTLPPPNVLRLPK